MKKIILLISVIVLIISGCWSESKKGDSKSDSDKILIDNDVASDKDALLQDEENPDSATTDSDDKNPDFEILPDGDANPDSEILPDGDGASLCGTDKAVCTLDMIEDCSKVKPGTYGHSGVPCLIDCSGWDTSSCATPYGFANIEFSTTKLMNIVKSGDKEYAKQFYDDIQRKTAGFEGKIGSLEFPGSTFTDAEIYSYKRTTIDAEGKPFHEILIKQVSYSGPTLADMLNPTVEFYIPGLVEKGDKLAPALHAGGIRFVIYELGSDFQTKECYHAFGVDGEFEVTVAEGLENEDMGNLTIVGKNLPLFYITETPHGNMIETGAFTGTACDRIPF